MPWLKTWSARGASSYSAFVGKWLTLISLIHQKGWVIIQGNEDVGSVQDFILLYLWLVWMKENGRQGESKITNANGRKLLWRLSSYKKLMHRGAFWIVYIAWRLGYKTVAYNASSVGVGKRNVLFCVCVAETVLSLLLLSILLCILLRSWFVNIIKWMGPINVNMKFQTLHYSVFFYPVLLHKLQIHMYIKTSFCSNFLAKTVYHVLS